MRSVHPPLTQLVQSDFWSEPICGLVSFFLWANLNCNFLESSRPLSSRPSQNALKQKSEISFGPSPPMHSENEARKEARNQGITIETQPMLRVMGNTDIFCSSIFLLVSWNICTGFVFGYLFIYLFGWKVIHISYTALVEDNWIQLTFGALITPCDVVLYVLTCLSLVTVI